jgi:protease PrsW
MTNILAVGTGGGRPLALAILLAVLYLFLVRLLDLNEKEPLWAVCVLFGTGALAGLLLYLGVSTVTLNRTVVLGPMLQEAAKLIALAAGIAVVNAFSRPGGLPQVHGVLDGIVYGTSAGLGFATGLVFVEQLLSSGAIRQLEVATSASGALGTLWPLALLGLAHGLFGAVIGVGFGVGGSARDPLRRLGAPILGVVAAIVLHVGYEAARRVAPDSVAGPARHWFALLLPLALVLAAALWALRRERAAIDDELPEEVESGVVTPDELRILQSLSARRSAYAKAFFSGDFDGWLSLRSLHNRQVQLAFAKAEEREGRAVDAQAPATLRDAIVRQREAGAKVAGPKRGARGTAEV